MTVSDGSASTTAPVIFQVETVEVDDPLFDFCGGAVPAFQQFQRAALPEAEAGKGYGASLAVTVGAGSSAGILPLTWSLGSGSLPPGLVIDMARGVSAINQTFDFTITVTDKNGVPAICPNGGICPNYSITVVSGVEGSPDADADGVADDVDNCPSTPNPAQTDTDSGGLGDACDPDDDNDGVSDANDAFPLDSTATLDSDGDGLGNNADSDDDNDGMLDSCEIANGFDPLDPADASQDADGDGVTNLKECSAGSDPHDPASVPRPKVLPWLKLLLLDN